MRAASRMPGGASRRRFWPPRPASSRGAGRDAQPVLPEWLTAGVGGFVRRHPAFTIFAVLISLSVLSIGRIIWSEHEGTLTRDTPLLAEGEYSPPAARDSGPQPNYGGRTPA